MALEKLNRNARELPRESFLTRGPDDFDDDNYFDSTQVECLCPKCGAAHVMKLLWIGRGTPRKFCPSCKSSRD
ncbi:MAG: hypothetical protein H8E17_17800 [Deltaproteobacteria bacterium]|nr:hypothetical protein [Deltaproteobacteria bacterium]